MYQHEKLAHERAAAKYGLCRLQSNISFAVNVIYSFMFRGNYSSNSNCHAKQRRLCRHDVGGGDDMS